MKIFELESIFVEEIPEEIEEGKIYISEKYGTTTHLCACGCMGKTITPLKEVWGDGWDLFRNQDKVTLRPSIGNWAGQSPYHAHYYITENKIEWL
jgi:hypothetical protein